MRQPAWLRAFVLGTFGGSAAGVLAAVTSAWAFHALAYTVLAACIGVALAKGPFLRRRRARPPA